MRKQYGLTYAAVLFLAVGITGVASSAFSQDSDNVVLVKGNPPLTQLMVGKVVVLLDWALELKLSTDQENRIKQILVESWKSGNRSGVRGALELIEIYERIFRMSESERNASRGKLHDLILQSIRAEPDDGLGQMLLSAYQAARSPSSGKNAPIDRSSTPAKSEKRVGGDGLTGIYRMVRPRAINIDGGFNRGYWVEYITLLPNGNIYWTLPPEGLLHFDPAVAERARPDDWGTYEVRNGVIHILRGPQRKPYVITRAGERLNNPPSLGKGTFRPVPPSDGLLLEGRYRRGETEPTITFNADGRFQDDGLFRVLGSTRTRPDGTFYEDDGRGGSGTYIIEQYTLELRYSDGRLRRVPFIAFPENLAKSPAVDSFILLHSDVLTRL